MFCPRCGTEISDSARFCTNCGTRLQHQEKSAPSAVLPVVKRNHKGAIIATVVVCCVIAAGTFGWAISRNGGASSVSATDSLTSAAKKRSSEEKEQAAKKGQDSSQDEDGVGRVTPVTGWFESGATHKSSDSTGPYISSAALSSKHYLVIDGAWAVSSSKDGAGDDPILQRRLVLRYDDKTRWVASGGDAEAQPVDPDYLVECVSKQSGLGIILHVKNGYLLYAEVAS